MTDPSAAILERIGEFGNLRIIKTVLRCYQDKDLLTAPLLEKVLRFAIVFNFPPVAAHLIKCYPYNLDTLACYSEMSDTSVRQTPLEYATARGFVEMIDLLLRAGTSPYVGLTDQKQHVIALAIRRADINLIKLIVSHDKQALKVRGSGLCCLLPFRRYRLPQQVLTGLSRSPFGSGSSASLLLLQRDLSPAR